MAAVPARQNALVTSFHPREAAWSENNLPDELFQLEPFNDWGMGTLAFFEDYDLTKDGHRDLNSTLIGYKDFDVPAQISIQPEPWRLEYWTDRLDPRFGTKDLQIRMRPAPGDKVPKTNALNMQKSRLRNALNIPNWSRVHRDVTCVECLIAEQIPWVSARHNTTLEVRSNGLVKPTLAGAKSGDPTARTTLLARNRFLRNNMPHQPSQQWMAKLHEIESLRKTAAEQGYPHWIFLPNKFKPQRWTDKADVKKGGRAGSDDVKLPEMSSIPTKALRWIKRCVREAAAAGNPMATDGLPIHARSWVEQCIDEGLQQPQQPGPLRQGGLRPGEVDVLGVMTGGPGAAGPSHLPDHLKSKKRQRDDEDEDDGEQAADVTGPQSAPRKRRTRAQASQHQNIGPQLQILAPRPTLRLRGAQTSNANAPRRPFVGLPSNDSPHLTRGDRPRKRATTSSRQHSSMEAGNMKRHLDAGLVRGGSAREPEEVYPATDPEDIFEEGLDREAVGLFSHTWDPQDLPAPNPPRRRAPPNVWEQDFPAPSPPRRRAPSTRQQYRPAPPFTTRRAPSTPWEQGMGEMGSRPQGLTPYIGGLGPRVFPSPYATRPAANPYQVARDEALNLRAQDVRRSAGYQPSTRQPWEICEERNTLSGNSPQKRRRTAEPQGAGLYALTPQAVPDEPSFSHASTDIGAAAVQAATEMLQSFEQWEQQQQAQAHEHRANPVTEMNGRMASILDDGLDLFSLPPRRAGNTRDALPVHGSISTAPLPDLTINVNIDTANIQNFQPINTWMQSQSSQPYQPPQPTQPFDPWAPYLQLLQDNTEPDANANPNANAAADRRHEDWSPEDFIDFSGNANN